MNSQVEEMHRVGYVGRRVELPCPLCACHPPYTSTVHQPKLALNSRPLRIVMEATLRGHNQSLIPFSAFLSKEWGQAENSKLLIMVWSFSDCPSSRSPTRVTSLKQKSLLSPTNLLRVSGALGQEPGSKTKTISKTKDAPRALLT